jgi:serine/threonine protein kinase
MLGVGELSRTQPVGSYRLVRALDGDGRVHEARHERRGGRFALKLLGDVDTQAFARAAHQATALRHPGIVQVVDSGTDAGRAFVVMEWVEGRSLAALLADEGALDAERVARLVDSVALGLQAAHRQGLSHGHLDPTRIFVLPSGGDGDETPGAERTKILGFGLGDDLAPGPPITEETPYMAPEQLAGEAQPLADQFALAAIVYELLTGVPPSSDGDERRPPPSIREYVPSLNVIVDDVVQRALSTDPGARWADVYTFSKRLREAIDAEGGLEREEKTRLAPLPLTITRAPIVPAPASVATSVSFDFPVIASVDVDLRTPAPRRLGSPISPTPGGPLMTQTPPPFPGPYRGQSSGRSSGRSSGQSSGQSPNPAPNQFAPPNQFPNQFQTTKQFARPAPARLPAPGRPYAIQPTPTFSFTDEPVAGPLWKPRGRRRGGGFGLVVLVVAAGLGGYFGVQTHAWQDVEPLVARGKQLLSSLRMLAPSAAREVPQTAPTGAAPSVEAATAEAEARTANGAPAPAAATGATAPTTHPEVVQIEPTPPPTPHARAQTHVENKVASTTATPATAKPVIAQPVTKSSGPSHASTSTGHRAAHPHASHARAPAFDEAAAEEALLNGP